MRRAAQLTALAEAASLDPTTNVEVLIRLENLAGRARRALERLVATKRSTPPPTLRQYLERHGHAQTRQA
jgi:hypothetical protein